MIPRRDIERRRSDTRLAILAINIVFCAFTLWLIIKRKKKRKKKVETKNGAEKKRGGGGRKLSLVRIVCISKEGDGRM